MNPLIRHLERKDVIPVHALGNKVPEFSADNEHAFWPLDTLERFADNGLSFVVEEEETTQIVGFFLAAYQPVTRKCTVENVYLSPQYRGMSLADACLHDIWCVAQRRGAVMLESIVATSNHASQRMFERRGLQTAGTYHWMLQFSQ